MTRDFTSFEPCVTRGEYWLLETAVGGRTPLHWLEAINLDQILNKPGHGLNRAGLLDTLLRLIAGGLIDTAAEGATVPVRLTREQLAAALDEDGSLRNARHWTYYGLTQIGGRQWEAFAAPNWSQYVSWSADGNEDPTQAECICADPDVLARYLDALRSRGDVIIDEATVRWDELQPWQATYWKVLTLGHRVTYQYRDVLISQRQATQHSQWSVLFPELCNRMWYRWR